MSATATATTSPTQSLDPHPGNPQPGDPQPGNPQSDNPQGGNPYPGTLRPGDVLLHLIATLLAPMFLAVCGGNLDFARMAALETVNAYCARGPVELIAVAQIVAHGLASVSAVCLSMADDIPLATTLRLRASAHASDRACDRARRALERNRAAPGPLCAPDPTPDPEADRKDAEVIARLAAVRRQGEALLAGHAAAGPAAPTREAPAPEAPVPEAPLPAAQAPTAPPAAPDSTAPATEAATATPDPTAPAHDALSPEAPAFTAPIPTTIAHQSPTPVADAPVIPTLALPTPAIQTEATSTPPAAAPRPAPPIPAAWTPSEEPSPERIQQLWGAAMTVVANEYSASMAHLPPAERDAARARAEVLTKAAADLFSGNVPPRLRSGDLANYTATNF